MESPIGSNRRVTLRCTLFRKHTSAPSRAFWGSRHLGAQSGQLWSRHAGTERTVPNRAAQRSLGMAQVFYIFTAKSKRRCLCQNSPFRAVEVHYILGNFLYLKERKKYIQLRHPSLDKIVQKEKIIKHSDTKMWTETLTKTCQHFLCSAVS